MKDPKVHVLAHIMEAEGAEGDAANELITFTKFGRSFVLDITSVLNLAGRIFTRGRTAFDVPEGMEGEEEAEDE
ncbi:hypothetical protein FRC11_013153 [Ceratobasidium sp. 423]|nr:hypothetical protein FRC11_013153 [Ceratobasidium sp. 423]